jgi:hypothetical protein
MTRSIPTNEQPRVRVYRGSLPLWLAALLVAPLGLLFLVSLAVAAAGVALAVVALPFLWQRRSRWSASGGNADFIELDPSDYHRVDAPQPGDERR